MKIESKLVYILTKEELEDYHFADRSSESFVFSKEELINLIEDYTNKIIKNSKATRNFKETEIIGYRDLKDGNNNTIGNPIPITKDIYFVDESSIKKQLELFKSNLNNERNNITE